MFLRIWSCCRAAPRSRGWRRRTWRGPQSGTAPGTPCPGSWCRRCLRNLATRYKVSLVLIMRLLVTDGWHGDHQEVDTVPVGQSLAVVEVRGVSRVLQEVDDAWGPVTLYTWPSLITRLNTTAIYTTQYTDLRPPATQRWTLHWSGTTCGERRAEARRILCYVEPDGSW